ncbi:MAG TPA: hypothetical protein VN905_03315 [Candidatus Binatia bacterium]|nr:hypothetical protein [Candidatus Binatia bacterium]
MSSVPALADVYYAARLVQQAVVLANAQVQSTNPALPPVSPYDASYCSAQRIRATRTEKEKSSIESEL